MAPQLYLVTPADPDPAKFATVLMNVLNSAEVAALLVRRGQADDAAYSQLASQVINIGQGAGCAVLLENDAALAKKLGADGVHITDGPEAVARAIAALKPKMIVGANAGTTRHDAMTLGEMDVDYLMFGPTEGASDPKGAELAQWWAATFEIPAVLSDPGASAENADSLGAEFLGLSSSIWSASSPGEALGAIADALKVSA
ncbi:thiamine phosphate synthase [Devosia submarina]|uniref:thiamine phosphate synthase n=1 Tax=Devosia submarina TaxID=1173082 RepID=UPI000D3CEEDB|nr:thiamine phosphate synthase [Devosia submarina]